MDDNFLPTVVHGKEETVVAKAAAENAAPLFTLKGFHISLKRAGCHLSDYARDALLNGFWKAAEILLGIFGEITDPIHL
jgi:hypothetical protein